MKKLLTLCSLFVFGIILLNNDSIKFFADVSNLGTGLLSSQEIAANLDKIGNSSIAWPLKEVTHRGLVPDYQAAKFTEWEELEDDYKTTFPISFTEDVNKYKYLAPAQIWESISNPYERQRVLFLKRLFTTSWTASYDCGNTSCSWWAEDTGTHAGIDLLSSIQTPIYSTTNGIVIQLKESNQGFGNYTVIASEIDDTIYGFFYAHMDGFVSGLREGDIVKKGELIGYLGNTGNSTAPHLHLQINILGKSDHVTSIDVAKELFEDWYGDLKGVKENTVNPISFIESHYNTTSDALEGLNDDEEENKTTSSPLAVETDEDEITEEKMHAISEEKDFELVSISSSKLDDQLIKGDKITLKINTVGETGVITISTNNNNIIPSTYQINPVEGKTEYEIELDAQGIGSTELIFSDGTNKETLFYSINEETIEAYGLKIEGDDTIYTTIEQEFVLYPIDKVGNKVSIALDGEFKVVLQNTETKDKTTISEFENTKKTTSINFGLTAQELGDYKIKVYFESDNQEFVATKNVETEIFVDYSIDENYGTSITSLYEDGIVKGSKGQLMPNNNITRGELVTILMRYKYGDKVEDFTEEMNKYISENGKFLNDVNGSHWADPYIYKAYVDGVIKGANGYANTDENTSKAELITIYGRFFGVSKYEIFTNWLDVDDDDWYKIYADAALNYMLYPFDDLKYFGAEEDVTRLYSFESLYRYMNFEGGDDEEVALHSSSEDTSSSSETTDVTDGTTEGSSDLQSLINSLLN